MGAKESIENVNKIVRVGEYDSKDPAEYGYLGIHNMDGMPMRYIFKCNKGLKEGFQGSDDNPFVNAKTKFVGGRNCKFMECKHCDTKKCDKDSCTVEENKELYIGYGKMQDKLLNDMLDVDKALFNKFLK